MKADAPEELRRGGTRAPGGKLFRKYVLAFVGLVGAVLAVNGALDAWFAYGQAKEAATRLQAEKAEAAAERIALFVAEIERQIGWTTHAQWAAGTVEQRRFDYVRLLRQVPAITELVQLDAEGREQLKVSRLAMDVVGSGIDHSAEPRFKEAIAKRIWFSPVYFRKESEPYLTMAVARSGRNAGVTVAEVNLKLIWDVVSTIKVGQTGYAFVVDGEGRLIAHPDISLVLRNTDLSALPQVAAARTAVASRTAAAAAPMTAPAPGGGPEVLSAFARTERLGWLVFVELPLREALAPLREALYQSLAVLAGALALSALAGLLLARKMVGPIRQLEAGAALLGGGDLGHRITVRTGDELERLGDRFNAMAGRLQESYADLERKVEDRTRELSEALKQQTATADVLKVISRSAFDLEAVLHTLVTSVLDLCHASGGNIHLRDGEVFRPAMQVGWPPEFLDYMRQNPVTPGPGSVSGRAALTGTVVQIPDVLADPDYALSAGHRLAGYRTVLGVPLLRDGEVVGVFSLGRDLVDPFTEREIELVQTFSDQAVIAIENVRLFKQLDASNRELSESLQQQTATADVLKVISRSAFDLQTVLDTLAESAARLCEAEWAAITRQTGRKFFEVASYGYSPEFNDYIKNFAHEPGRGTVVGRALLEGRTIQITDVLDDVEFTMLEGQRLGGFRTALGVPLLREGSAIGVIVLSRSVVRPFNDKQIELVETFADQAVIAIENVRLFDEVQARTRELQESLEYQTATSDVLNVISRSPSQAQPVLEAIVVTAARLCQADHSTAFRLQGDHLHLAASSEASPVLIRHLAGHPIPVDATTTPGRAALERRAIHAPDITADGSFTGELARLANTRTVLSIPLLRRGAPIGVITTARTHVEPFSDKQIELVTTFAEQAVIAIENARLFEEVQARTRELQESLEYQTATSDVLNVISRSPSELQPVLDAIVRTAARLCASEYAFIVKCAGDECRLAAANNVELAHIQFLSRNPVPIDRDSVTGRVAAERRTIHVPDVLADPEFRRPDWQEVGKQRTVLGVPLLREGALVGVLILARTEVQPFTDKQVELVTTFADQAVIAIENVRLFDEVQARTRELQLSLEYQTATSEVLEVISRSPSQFQPVLDAIVETAGRLCEADYAVVFELQEDGWYHVVAVNKVEKDFLAYLRAHPISPARDTVTGRAALEKSAVHIPDVLADPEYTTEMAERGGFRSNMAVPLLRKGHVIGVITVVHRAVKPFTQKQIDLVATFANQAVIAIENTRLFEEVQARTRELQESLEYQTATGDVLNVISRSPNDLKPVLDTIVETAARLCEADYAHCRLERDGLYHVMAFHALAPGLVQHPREPVAADRSSLTGRVLSDRRTIHVPDVLDDPEDEYAVRVGIPARTLLGVPLMREGVAVGVLGLFRKAVKPFSQRQIDLVTTFANQAVIAISNVGLFDEVQARTRELTVSLEQQTATADVLKVISRSTFDLQTVLDTLVESAVNLGGGTRGGIFFTDGGVLRLQSHYGLTSEHVERLLQHPIEISMETMAGRPALLGRTVHVPDILADSEFRNYETLKIAKYRAFLGVPLMREGNVFGVLSLSRTEPVSFSPQQIDLVTTFADQAVIAIENVRLFDEVQARTGELARSVEELRTLGETGQAVSGTLDLGRVLDLVASRALALGPADGCALFRYERSARAFSLWRATGLAEEHVAAIRQLRVDEDETTMGRALKERQAVVVPDLGEMPSWPLRDAALAAGQRSVLIVPLIRAERRFGALVLFRKGLAPFEPRTTDLMQTFANQSVLAIQNARLFREIEENGRQLEIASQHKSQFLANMSHELRTPLNAVLGYTELLSDGLYGELPAKATGVLERIQSNGQHLLALINDVLDLSKIEAGQLALSLEDYALTSLVQSVVTVAEPLAKAKGLALVVDVAERLPIGRGDERRLTQVLLNLVGNAVKFTDQGSVAIVARAAQDSFELTVTDTGPGIAPEDQERIFDAFQQVDNTSTRKKGGTGLGLAISKRMVEMHGGGLAVESAPGRGSTFRLTLPIRVESYQEAAE